MVRSVSLIMLAGGLGILVFQNRFPVLPVVFLGTRSLALPLGVWVVAAIILGAATTGLIYGLLYLLPEFPSIRRTEQEQKPTFRGGGKHHPFDVKWRQAGDGKQPDPIEDWEDDEIFGEPPQNLPLEKKNTTLQPPVTQVGPREPSTYSYGFKERKEQSPAGWVDPVYNSPSPKTSPPNPASGNPMAGDPKAIYDADFRLINPPLHSPPPPSSPPYGGDRQDWEASTTENDDWI